MEETAFQFPDRYMLRFYHDGSQFDSVNWCDISERVIKKRRELPFEMRESKAMWHGASTGKNRKYFGYDCDGALEDKE